MKYNILTAKFEKTNFRNTYTSNTNFHTFVSIYIRNVCEFYSDLYYLQNNLIFALEKFSSTDYSIELNKKKNVSI